MYWLIGAAIVLVAVGVTLALRRRRAAEPARAVAPPREPAAVEPALATPALATPALATPALAEPALAEAALTERGPAPPSPAPVAPEPAPAAEPEPIVIAGLTVSPSQYRALFPDLEILPDSDEVLRHHFVHAGRQEIANRQRVPWDERVDAVALQQLSPLAPASAPSPYWRFFRGTDTLDIIFSHMAPDGQFEPQIPHTTVPDSRLYLKGETHGFFQRGIPGLTGSVDETARWIEAVIARARPRRIRTIGFSAGAYGALLFGHLLSADAIYACAPEVMLGLPHHRSSRWYKARVYDPAYRDLRPFLPGLRKRLVMIYPAYEPLEFRMLQAVREAGIDNLVLGVDFHPGGLAMPLNRVFDDNEMPMRAEHLVICRHPGAYDDAMIEDVAQAHEAIADGQIERSEPLLASVLVRDPTNYGFMCHLGVHRALRGDPDGAEQLIRHGVEAMMREYGGLGREVARHAKGILRNHYEPNREQIMAVEPVFDRVYRDLLAGPGQAEAEAHAQGHADSHAGDAER